MSARSMVTSNPVFKQRKSTESGKRAGRASNAEKQFIGQLLEDSGGQLTKQQIQAAGKLMRRQTRTIRKLVEDARKKFTGRAELYADLHFKAVQDGIDSGDPKGIEAGMKGAQWAMERISHEGVRIIDKDAEGVSGTRVMIGIQVGGLIASANKTAMKSLKSGPNTLDEGGTGGIPIEAEIMEEKAEI